MKTSILSTLVALSVLIGSSSFAKEVNYYEKGNLQYLKGYSGPDPVIVTITKTMKANSCSATSYKMLNAGGDPYETTYIVTVDSFSLLRADCKKGEETVITQAFKIGPQPERRFVTVIAPLGYEIKIEKDERE